MTKLAIDNNRDTATVWAEIPEALNKRINTLVKRGKDVAGKKRLFKKKIITRCLELGIDRAEREIGRLLKREGK